MPTDPTHPRPDGPTDDLALANVASRVAALRDELDRLDATAHQLDRARRVEVGRRLVAIRCEVDFIEETLAGWGAGL